jgi:hypothetical protein
MSANWMPVAVPPFRSSAESISARIKSTAPIPAPCGTCVYAFVCDAKGQMVKPVEEVAGDEMGR